MAQLPQGVQGAVTAGALTPPLLLRYLELDRAGGLTAWLLKFAGFRDRILMDSGFLTKLGIEMAIGAVAQVLAEFSQRKERLLSELDFVFADVLTCLVANFAAMWLSAPALGALGKSPALRNIPDNAFQVVPPGIQPYTLFNRVISPLFKVPDLFAVGFFATAVGYGTTAVLTRVRSALSGGKEGQQANDIPVLKTCVAVGVYLAISTNIRYQLISGVIEQRVLDKVFASQPVASRTGSFVVRSLNTYLGSALMIEWLKILRLQGSETPTPCEVAQ